MNKLIHCENLAKSYLMGNVTVSALKNINLDVAHGEYLAILGPSGSGKSTLMNLLGCLDSPTHGSYFLNGKNVSGLSRDELAKIRNQEIGFIFQNFNLLHHSNALDNVALPLLYRGLPTKERQEKAAEVLRQVGLANRLYHLPNELSGGQRQRVAIARALVTEPNVILADEPTGNLDTHSGKEIIRLFENFTQANKTVIIVTHDILLAKRTQRILSIQDGEIVSDKNSVDV